MKDIGEEFGARKEHYRTLRVNGKHLYWNGKKLQTEGWSRGERLTLMSIILAFVLAIPTALAALNWDQLKDNVCSFSSFEFCSEQPSDNKSNSATGK